MKSNIILILLVLLTILGGVFIYHKVAVIETRFETLKESNIRLQLNKPLTSGQIKERQFKEEMYIRQQERDTNLILSFFSFFSILVGFFTFRSVREEFVNKWNEISQANESTKADIENKYIEISHNYKKLEVEHNLKMGEVYCAKGGELINTTQSLSLYIYYKMKGISLFISALNYSQNKSSFFIDPIIKNINSQLSSINNISTVSESKSIYQTKITKELLEESTELIEKISKYLISNNYIEEYHNFIKSVSNMRYEE